MLRKASIWAVVVVALFLILVVVFRANAQCPPHCGADWSVPNHFRVPDVEVSSGTLVKIPVWFEGYQPVNITHFRFELDPAVAEFVGVLPGPDAPLVGRGGSWFLESTSFVHTANEAPEHPGWQLNYIRFENWGLPDKCGIPDKIWGSLGAFRDLGIRTEFLIFYIIVQGNAPGVTPIWFDRDCNGEPWGSGQRPGTRDSFMSFHPEGLCLTSSASACIREPGEDLASLSSVPWAPAGKVMAESDPIVVVNDDDDCDAADDDCTPVHPTYWGHVKDLYR